MNDRIIQKQRLLAEMAEASTNPAKLDALIREFCAIGVRKGE